MTNIGLYQVLLFFLTIIITIKPLGQYIAQVYENKPCWLDPSIGSIEHAIYRLANIDNKREMEWKSYLLTMLVFNAFGILAVYAIQRIQHLLPLNPQSFPAVATDLAFNTAVSFATNTNWQAYSGESTLSYLTQMVALTVQNFLSAATGMSLLLALIRGITRQETKYLGNFWVDTVRGVLYIFLPLSLLFALILISQGVIQNFKSYEKVDFLEPVIYQQLLQDAQGQIQKENKKVFEQIIPMGPVASQVAIKQIGTNGGGYFNANSAHPYENPTPLSNFLEMLALLLIPAASCYAYGIMVSDKRQGRSIFIAMLLILLLPVIIAVIAEQHGNDALTQLGIDRVPQQDFYPGGNMEGKETRIGNVSSSLWASATTASANGSVNAMHDSFTPLGGLIPLWLIQLGEVVFGGVGSGLYGMLMLVIITVFVSGLMVGRTPEYLGKKIESFEIKMALLAVLIMPFCVLVFTALAVITKMGTQPMANPGAHGFTEVLYAFSSMANNNGSAFAGLNVNTSFYNIAGGIVMLVGRYWIAIPILAIAGSLAQKKSIPDSLGTLQTHNMLFIILLISVTLIIGALTFFPALSLGPIVEQLILWEKYAQ